MRRILAMMILGCTLGGANLAVAQVEPTGKQPSADDPSARPHRLTIEFTTLRLLRDKGIISDAEFESAMRDVVDTNGDNGGESLTLVVGKWSTTMYGFVEADNIWDSTESFNESAGNNAVSKGNTYAGNNGRFTESVRNTRLGFRLRAPEFHRVRASAMLEMDFLGNQPQIGYAQAYQISENAYFTNPAFRARHLNLKVETPYVDILFGQYWDLFGWQSVYHPTSVQIQGLPSQIYSRTPQLRLSHAFKTKPVTIELAFAMMRSPERDSWTPEGQGGVRLAVNQWTGVSTAGAAGTSIQPLSVAFTADVRQFNAPQFAAKQTNTVGKTGYGLAVDGFIPIVHARKGHKRNSLSVQGEYVYGQGIADLYTGLNSGALGTTNPALPNPTMANPAPTFTPDIDPALAVFTTDNVLHLIHTQTYLVGIQYYLPVGDGRMFVAANYSDLTSDNAVLYKASKTATALSEKRFADGNLFFDATPAVRLGLEYAWFRDDLTDGHFAVNHRVQLSAFYIF